MFWIKQEHMIFLVLGSILIEKINGCFYNVAGLPVNKFIDLIEKFNYKIL